MKFKLGDIASLKRVREIIKYTIITGECFVTINCIFLLIGFNVPIINLIFGMSLLGYIVLILASYVLGFCGDIRYMLTHIFITRCCVSYLIYVGFDELLTFVRLSLSIIGIFLILKTLRDCYVKRVDVIGS